MEFTWKQGFIACLVAAMAIVHVHHFHHCDDSSMFNDINIYMTYPFISIFSIVVFL